MSEKTAAPPKAAASASYDRLDQLVRQFEKVFNILIPVVAIVVSLLIGSIIILAQGASPLEAYAALVQGAFGGAYNLSNSLVMATPLILTGLGIALAARCGIINLGGEGQIVMGGIFATFVGTLPQLQGLPAPVYVPLCLLAAFLGGALWAAVPGYFFARHGVNFMITTMLLNDIANGIITALVQGPMKEADKFAPQSAQVAVSARLPILFSGTRLHAGFLLAVILAALAFFVLFKTPFGHDLRTLGENPTAARHAGIHVFGMQMVIVILAGGLAGMAGSAEILGSQYRLRSGFLSNYGYEALAVAMLGQKHPFGVVIAGILFGALKSGRGSMARAADLPTSFSMVLSGVIIFFVAISPILMKLPRYLALREMNRKNRQSGSLSSTV